MRLHRLVLQGVGPFKERQTIDFDRLAESRLFLIDGKTGAGKSTIIDCITYALFNTMAGAGSGMERMRSDACRPEEESYVELTFSVDGRTYLVRRNPEYQRAKKAGQGTTKQEADASLIITDAFGVQLPAPTKSKEIVALIEQVLGMSADQFRRLVVLPQGEFATLLTSSSSERQKILEPLIAEPLYRRIQFELEERLKRAREARLEAVANVESAVTKFLGDLDALGDAQVDIDRDLIGNDKAADDVRDSAMSAAIALVSDLQSAKAAAAADETAAADSARTASDTALRVAEVAASLIAAREAFRDVQSEVDVADRDLAERELDDVLGQIAERLGRLEPLVQWEANAAERDEAHAGRLRDQTALVSESAELAAADSAYPAEHRQLSDQLKAAVIAAAAVETLTREAQAAAALADAAGRRDELLAEISLAEGAVRQAIEADAQSLQAYRDALAEITELQKLQIAQRAAFLAATLHADEACPVCGSLDHPSPAVEHPGEELITDERLELAGATASAHEAARKETEEALSRARDSLAGVEAALAGARGVLGVHADSPIDELHALTTAALVDLERAETSARRVAELSAQLEEIEKSAVARQDRLVHIEGELSAIATLESEAARGDVDHHERIAAEAGTAPTALQAQKEARLRRARLERLRETRDRLATLAREHPEAADVDPAEASVRAKELVAVAEKVDARAQSLKDESASLRTTLDQMRGHRGEFAAACERSAEVRARTRGDVRLGELAVGGRGNIRKTDLATFALQRKFASVLDAASHHLRTMSMGRYGFDLDPGKRGNEKVGLNIFIADSRHGYSRDPRTLSGGEKFYASLSLALGLAQVVQAEVGGARLEMLFVDEGFGSLDADTLSVVIEQLERLQSSGRIVGVISHVSEMKSAIADKIEIVANGDGTSRIVGPDQIS